MSEQQRAQHYYYPNKMSRILLLSMHDVMGQNGLSAVLNTAGLPTMVGNYPPEDFAPGLSFEELGRLMAAVEGIYGIRGGRRLVRQSGRRCFKYAIEGFGGVIGFADVALRVLPISIRVRIGLEVLREIMSRYSDQSIALGEDDVYYYLVMSKCGLCWGRHTTQPACGLLVGLVEEVLYWVSRGFRFLVEETACIAVGHDACVIQVGKTPLS